MSISLGSTSIGSLYLGSAKIGEAYFGNVKVYPSTPVDPYNPLNLPPYTIRVKFTDGVTPTFSKGTAVQVSSSPNVWDLTYENADWTNLLYNQTSLNAVLGANTSSVTNMFAMLGHTSITTVPLFDTRNATIMSVMFTDCASLTTVPLFDIRNATNISGMLRHCTSLTTVPLFDTSNVSIISQLLYDCSAITSVPLFDTGNATDMSEMFNGCTSLTAVPLLNTSSATNMSYMFKDCVSVQSGALALYQQASSQAVPPSSHYYCFKNCGSNTVTGAAELAQIPSSWGGTGS